MTTIPHFIDPNTKPGQLTIEILDTILAAAGPNFSAPYNANIQPINALAANLDPLMQLTLPAGASIEGHADLLSSSGIGSSINDVIGGLAYVLSAYAFVLPILGVIRGLIEIICALMNPWSVARAVIRFFSKWLPPFLALFPAFAAVILVIAVIKIIIAIVFYILNQIVVLWELIKTNVEALYNVALNPFDSNDERRNAINAKLVRLLNILLQKLGIIQLLAPVLDIIFTIMGLSSGFPCGKGSSNTNTTLDAPPFPSTRQDALADDDEDRIPATDSTCCDEDTCPEILTSRDNNPAGIGLVVASSFCSYAPGFVYELITGNADVEKLEPYQESMQAQLDGCLDEPLSMATPAGTDTDRSLIKLKLTGRRGQSSTITVPVLLIDGTRVKFVSKLGALFVGSTVDYELQPDHDMMMMAGVFGIGCHPDVQEVKANIAANFPDGSVLSNNPDLGSIQDDFNQYREDVENAIADLRAIIDDVATDDRSPTGGPPIPPEVDPLPDSGLADSETDDDIPTLDERLAAIDAIAAEITRISNEYIDNLLGKLNGVINSSVSAGASTITVNKNTVTADGEDFATITVTPRDVGGILLLRNVPEGVNMSVVIDSDFGTVSDQQFNNSAGTITANITSSLVGEANIVATVNGAPITNVTEAATEQTVLQVSFIADGNLPPRRRVTKGGGTTNTGFSSDTEPGVG